MRLSRTGSSVGTIVQGSPCSLFKPDGDLELAQSRVAFELVRARRRLRGQRADDRLRGVLEERARREPAAAGGDAAVFACLAVEVVEHLVSAGRGADLPAEPHDQRPRTHPPDASFAVRLVAAVVVGRVGRFVDRDRLVARFVENRNRARVHQPDAVGRTLAGDSLGPFGRPGRDVTKTTPAVRDRRSSASRRGRRSRRACDPRRRRRAPLGEGRRRGRERRCRGCR